MDYKKLDVWKLSVELVVLIYKITEKFPEKEKYGLVSQMRRCSVSVPSNIAEGKGRGSDKSLINFLRISLGSLYELETQLFIGARLSFIDINILKEICTNILLIRKKILSLIKSIS